MTSRSHYLNDGSSDRPKFRVYLNLDNLSGLDSDSLWPGFDGLQRYQLLKDDGFEGVQLTSEASYLPGTILPYCGLDRVNRPEEADLVAARHAARGDECITVHVGWGIEDDDESFRLVEAILAASEKRSLPIFIETHRATITQDLWRTVRLANKFPEMQFNGDFSHYYCGQELVYGDWEKKLAFMDPIFARVGFIHGRIASPGCMQVPIDSNLTVKPLQAHGKANYLEHFRQMWIRAMCGFLRAADFGSVLVFAPELLPSTNYYARMFPSASGVLVEETDRYLQAIRLKELARACFIEAQKLVETPHTAETEV
jgi:hypothetical protein